MESSSILTTEVENESTTVHRNWLELPRDVTANILQRLGTIEILSSACKVCPLWWNICKDPHMWRTIRTTRLDYARYNYGNNLVKIFRTAVERSCGQVEDIDIEEIGTDDLLKHIVDNCACHLRRLRLANCDRLSDIGFIEAAKKLSQLEELDVSQNRLLSSDSLEVVGRSCPLLKSLKYGLLLSDYSRIDVHSFVVANTMPGLLHLKIFGDMPSDGGIQAILDGCHLLESFDLGGCYTYYFNPSLEKRCFEQIKVFVPPTLDYDSSDYGSINSNWSSYEDCDFDI